ncbi:hypothetical protein [Streptomyces sp. SAJ15]|uniref:alpha/beta hydrolase n=1 Tax=Streptomyces sp. SAJ15 TaxID=2011095 RepID=UPI0037DA200E
MSAALLVDFAAPQMPAVAAAAERAPGPAAPGTPAEVEDLAGVRTNATLGAEPARKARPLVVLSPGFGMSRLTLTALGEDLASRGYAVAAVDHTYEAPVEFPGGRIETCEIYVNAFVDRHLRGTPSPLLDRPSAAYPEVNVLKK